MVDCAAVSSLPDVDIGFGGRDFSLTPKQYILKVKNDDGETVCLTGFMTLDLAPQAS